MVKWTKILISGDNNCVHFLEKNAEFFNHMPVKNRNDNSKRWQLLLNNEKSLQEYKMNATFTHKSSEMNSQSHGAK